LTSAALENQVTEENIDQIQGQFVTEAANGSVTLEANRAWCDGFTGYFSQCWGCGGGELFGMATRSFLPVLGSRTSKARNGTLNGA
jgi:hypothetical protein